MLIEQKMYTVLKKKNLLECLWPPLVLIQSSNRTVLLVEKFTISKVFPYCKTIQPFEKRYEVDMKGNKVAQLDLSLITQLYQTIFTKSKAGQKK